MEVKKSPEADIDKRKGAFIALGLLLASSILLVSFEMTVFVTEAKEYAEVEDNILEEEIFELPPDAPPPPPPPPPPPAPSTDFEVTEEEDIEETLEVMEEVDDDEVIEVIEETPPAPVVEKIFDVVEEQPEFPGGTSKMYEYLRNNIKYPPMARESGIQGTVYVQFVVGKNGSIEDINVLRGIGGGCDEEAVRVVKAMPKWTPGKQRGKAVKVRFTLPIKFRLG